MSIAGAPSAAVTDLSPSEHIYIGSEESDATAAAAAHKVREKFELKNAIRRSNIELTVFEEGFLKVVEYSNGSRGEPYRLDLRYVDPVPSITHVLAGRSILAAIAGGAFAALAALLLQFSILPAVTFAATLVGFGLMTVALAVTLYRSHEKIEFSTIHGRAVVLTLIVNLGGIRRARTLLPGISRAIEEIAETINADPITYLRAEMREHYRLRRDGVLTNQCCSDSTGRILAQFDVQL
jgi:uncharacterized MnhB-related membrane protein